MSRIESVQITLREVLCVFPYFEKNIENRYGATFLIDKKDVVIKKEIDDVIQDFKIENDIPQDIPIYCIYDEDLNRFEGYWSLKAYSHREVKCIDRHKKFIDNRTVLDYSIVNVNISFWYQINKSIRANLGVIQYLSNKEDEF